jgi:hypothetical protein
MADVAGCKTLLRGLVIRSDVGRRLGRGTCAVGGHSPILE